MARDHKPGALLDRALRVLEDAAGDLDHPAARLAADVLVVLLGQLVVDLAVAQVDALDQALLLHTADSSENGGVVSRAEGLHDRFVELVDRPEVLLLGGEERPDLVADGAGPRHAPSLRALDLRN